MRETGNRGVRGRAGNEMSDIMLWDLKRDIGYVDECDLKIVEMVCVKAK